MAYDVLTFQQEIEKEIWSKQHKQRWEIEPYFFSFGRDKSKKKLFVL